jgi:hypothetical protein
MRHVENRPGFLVGINGHPVAIGALTHQHEPRLPRPAEPPLRVHYHRGIIESSRRRLRRFTWYEWQKFRDYLLPKAA